MDSGLSETARQPIDESPQRALSDFILAAGQWVFLCLLADILGDTDIDAE